MSVSHMRPEALRVRRLEKVEKEAVNVKSLYFRDERCSRAAPGQYVMIWVPGVDEVPMSLSNIELNGMSSVTVRSVGEATRALCGLRKGDKVGLRGPLGNGYTIFGVSPFIVAGGIGVASLAPLAELMMTKGLKPTFVLGARSREQLVFRNRLKDLLHENLLIATDDGSCGFKGFASEYAVKLMDERRFDSVYTCGPELMMAFIFKEAEAKGIPIQASLERYIKCAVGLCGSCAIGPYRVCKDGPVFNTEQLRTVQDWLGLGRMDPSGRVIVVDH